MATLLRSRRDRSTEPPPPAQRPTAGTASRRPGTAVLGIGIVLVCAAIGSQLVRGHGRLAAYVALAHPVAAGQSLRPEDLAVAELSPGPGFVGIPASEARLITGKRLIAALPAGTLLLAADVNLRTAPPRDSALVGTDLPPENLPSGLEAGDRVLVVFSGQSPGSSANGAPSNTSTLLGQGTVFSVSTPGSAGAGSAGAAASNGSVTVTVAVPPNIAGKMAAASAAGAVSLVELPAAPVAKKSTR